jgi:acyl carrier protein
MFIVEIEDTLSIEMPLDVASYDEMYSLANFVNFLEKIQEVENENKIKEN